MHRLPRLQSCAAAALRQQSRGYAAVQSDIFKPSKFGGKYTVTLIPGDGIGAEVAESVKTIFKADNVPVEFEQVDVSGVDTGDETSSASRASYILRCPDLVTNLSTLLCARISISMPRLF